MFVLASVRCRGRVRISDRFGSPTAGPDRRGVGGEVNHTAHRRGVGGEVNLPPAADDDKKKRGQQRSWRAFISLRT